MQIAGGDKGHPCLVPLPSAKTCDILSDMRMAACGEAYSSRTHVINLGPNPNLDNTAHRYLQLTLLNALLASRDNSALLPATSVWVCMFKKSRRRLVAVEFLGMKPA